MPSFAAFSRPAQLSNFASTSSISLASNYHVNFVSDLSTCGLRLFYFSIFELDQAW